MSQPNWENRSDAELVVAALLGNLSAFDELAIRFRPTVETVVSQYLRSAQDVEDGVQDVFLLAFKALPDLYYNHIFLFSSLRLGFNQNI